MISWNIKLLKGQALDGFLLTEEQKANNKGKSRTLARVEHVFGFVENSMHSSIVRTIVIVKAQ
jgi:hypothetical protein